MICSDLQSEAPQVRAADFDALKMAGHLDNPAGRLLDLFERARSVQNLNTSFQVWAKVFDISINTAKGEYEVIQNLYGIVELIDDLEEQIGSVDDEDERAAFMRPLSRFRSIILISHAANTSTN